MQGRLEHCDHLAWLDVDAEQGFYEMAQHLMALGHRHLAYVSGDPKIYSSGLRLRGLQRAVAEANLPPLQVFEGDFSARSGVAAVEAMVASQSQVTALICANDAMAMGAVSAAGQHGLQVPEDLSVTGYDGVRVAEMFNPPITTLSHSAAECGADMASMIVGLIKGQAPQGLQRLVSPALIQRGSTQPLKGLS